MKLTYKFRDYEYFHFSCCFYSILVLHFLFCLPTAFCGEPEIKNGNDDAAIETRLKQTVEYLASRELSGRGPGSEGLGKAAEFIAERMSKIGLKTDTVRGAPYQYFDALPPGDNVEIGFSRLNIFSNFSYYIRDLIITFGDLSPNPDVHEGPKQEASRYIVLKNVVAVLEGKGPFAQETIVIGAHYDHLGTKKSYNGERVMFPGADDNASGVAVMLETANILAHRKEKLPRRILFVAFSGEELGLVGSFYYTSHPVVPLNKTIAMINLDVVGKMENNVVVTMGTSTSPVLQQLTEKAVKRHDLTLLEIPSVFSGSDHMPFYSHRIPIVFFLTQSSKSNWHQPTDTPNTLNYVGMRQLSQIAAELAVSLAEADNRPEFSESGALDMLQRNLIRLLGRLTGK